MLIEHPYSFDKNSARNNIDDYIDKLKDLQFPGNFKITELLKSWSDNEMQYSLCLKQGSIERRIKGILRLKDDMIIINFELPEVVKNFIKEEKLESLIKMHLENAINKV
jgi:hypothetical protein